MGHDPLDTNFEQPARWVSGIRAFGYAFASFLVFGLAAGQIGIVAELFQKYGNEPANYPSHMIKYTLGLILFNALLSLLLVIGSYWAPSFFFVFVVFANMVMWITSAGVLNRAEPYRAGNCGSTFSPPFDRFVGDCKLYAASEALSWTLWALTFVLMITLILDFFVLKNKKKTVYGA
ncbi:hypothetical protein BCR35DRAFT_299197 [Leucosporidium creatinivorum]|uniref:MARVEL domain-containing protein n=1 Tax=Leucosporidium creatinivorum TaxID=106004 RepID=A0A1Y2G166_9BASI|nr:hypothetical protein BCR35DRAFT_299197 [Leucosporidium creatinivorum]